MTDSQTGEGLPFANVYITGKFQGTSTDLEGNYTLEVRLKTDSLSASSLGYATVTKVISRQIFQTINFELQPESIGIREVVVSAGGDPAEILFRKIVRAKPRNNPNDFKTFQYESYAKYQIDLDNITPKELQKNILLKGFEFLEDYIDTLSERGKSTLPIFLLEQISDNYEQINPRRVVERVKGQKLTMLRDNPIITELMSNANQHFNIYENMLTLMGRNFISPIADYGLSVYKYDINQFDTLFISGEPHFTMKFKPKRRGENAFSGKMIVNIKTYAVSSIEATIPSDVNLGFIRDFQFVQEYIPYSGHNPGKDSVQARYIPANEGIKMRFSANIGKGAMLVLKKSKSYEKQKVNEPINPAVFDPYKTTVVEDSAYLRSETFWDTMRHQKLLDVEAGIYEMVDSLKRTSKYKIIKYTLSTLASGYAKFGPVSLGHIATTFSRNHVEGWRFRMGILTNRDFSERVNLYAYGAYGLDDRRFKCGGKMIFIISRKPWHRLTFFARTDVDLMSRHAEEMDRDNVFTIVQKKNISQRLYNIDDFKILYDNEFYKDLTSYLQVQYRQINPYFDFYYEKDGTAIKEIITSEISYALRWQHKSHPLPGTFDREAKANRFFAQFRKKTDFPVVWLRYLAGLPDIMGSQFSYHDFSMGLQGDITVTAKQSMYYNLWLGKIFGTVPFLLLKNPEGNFSYVHNKYMFNNMSLLEFSADRYVSLNYQYFFGGWLGDRLPYISKLKLRAIATANVFYGNVSKENQQFNLRNNIGIAHPVPYVEAGFGIENILNILRFDFIWRVTHRAPASSPFGTNFGIYASLFIKI